MPFVKLDCGILNSTLWFERTAREIFITSLLMAEPFETKDPLPQIAINSLELTGWSVPPGWYGFIQAASVGIIHRARLEFTEDTRAALTSLGEPEVSSRSQDFEGRRLVRVDGGFIVLNFIKYRDKDATTADRSKRWRERQKLKQATRVLDTPTRVIRHQAEAEAEAEVSKNKRSQAADKRSEPNTNHSNNGHEPDVPTLVGIFSENYPVIYAKVRTGAHYRGNPVRDYPHYKELVAGWPLPRLEKMLELFLLMSKKDANNIPGTPGQFLNMAPECDRMLREHGK